MPPQPVPAERPRLLVLELWGLGDLTFATAFLRAATAHYEVTLLAKPHARPLLEPAFPTLRFLELDAPWTLFRGKYRFWRWPWPGLGKLLRQLRALRFQAGVSVRADPRDHLLLRLAGVRRRFGFPSHGSQRLLTRSVTRTRPKQHRVEDWAELARALALPLPDPAPALVPAAYSAPRLESLLAGLPRPLLCLHTGARIPVRRWPAASFRTLLERLRQEFSFSLLLVPDPDGYGAELAPLAQALLPPLSLGEMVHLLSRVDLLLCNDSGPMHVAVAVGRPVIALFGPTDPEWFGPWGAAHHVVIRDLCALRPCFDYCPFPEPYCLTRLTPELVYGEIAAHLRRLQATGEVALA